MNSVDDIPNGTDAQGGCDVWHGCSHRWVVPEFASWADVQAAGKAAIAVPFSVGRSAAPNVAALISSQPFERFSSGVVLTLPSPVSASKLYLVTANLAKQLKCYMPHAEVEFRYVGGARDTVQLTPPYSFSTIGGNPGWEAFVPAHVTFPFGTLTYSRYDPGFVPHLAVMDVVVPRRDPITAVSLRTVVTETVFGVMAATLLRAE